MRMPRRSGRPGRPDQAERHPGLRLFSWKPIELVDIGIGVFGFLAAAMLVITGISELVGVAALGSALGLLALVAALALLIALRVRMLRAEARGGEAVSTAWGGNFDEYRRRRTR
jgi:hypothetical protein